MESIQTIVDKHDEQLAYDKIIELLQEAKENEEPLDEGVGKALIGAAAGITVGPSIMKGVCHVLGIDEKGTLGNLMTSSLVLTALAAYLGWRN